MVSPRPSVIACLFGLSVIFRHIDFGSAQSLAPVCYIQADIIFVVDSSGSINDADANNWNIILNFITAIVGNLNIGYYETRVGMVTFSNRGRQRFALNTYNTTQDVQRAVRAVPYEGFNTNTSGGIEEMLLLFDEDRGDRAIAPNTAIVITDGQSTRDTDKTIRNANEAKRRGITMLVIGITDKVDMNELNSIASRDDDGDPLVFTVDNFNQVNSILDEVVEQACIQPTLPPTTESPLINPLPCGQVVDLMFLLDSSGSIQASNFNSMRAWLIQLVVQFDVENDRADIGIITFSNNARLRIETDQFSDRRELMEAMEQIPYEHGTTNTADALRMARQHLLSKRREDRQQVVVLVTDGQSDSPSQTLNQAMLTKQENIHIIVIVVGNWFNMQEVNGIASHPYEVSRIHLDSWSQLNDDFKQRLFDLMCNNMDECASNPCMNAVRCLNGIGFYSCVCIQGWGGINCGQRCNERVDIVFAIDASSSIGRENFERVTDFVRDVIEGLRIGTSDSSSPTRVGVMTYSDNTNILFHLNDFTNKYDILNAFPPVYTKGSTRTESAVRVVREDMFTAANGDQPGVRNLLVLITDGRSTNEADTWEQARLTREAGIDILTIGIGRSIRQSELEAIASYPNVVGENVLLATTFELLNMYLRDIIDAACNNDNNCDGNQCRNGAQCVDTVNGYACRCREGFSGKFCERDCDGRADIIFAIDVSGSIRRERFPMIQAFVKGVVDEFEVSQDKARVGIASWSDNPRVEFHLDAFELKQDVLSGIGYIRYLGGRTHTASCLRLIREQMFVPQNGDRGTVPNYLYVITDGNSNINAEETVEEATILRSQGVYIVTVSVGRDLNRMELMGMASEVVAENIFEVERYDQLPSMIDMLPQAICNSENECNSSPCRNGGQCVNDLSRYYCNCPEGRTGYNCQLSCRRSVDVCIMIDLSGSTVDEYIFAMTFVREAVYGLDYSFGRARVAVITYGDRAVTRFYLNEYSTREEIINALRFMPNKGKTNTQQALSFMRNDVFRSNVGDRSGVPNIGIVVTDGKSNIDRGNTIPEATRAKNEDIALYVVALGDEVEMGEVNAMAGYRQEPVSDYVYAVRQVSDAPSMAANLIQHLCQ